MCKPISAFLFAAFAAFALSPLAARAVTIDWSLVGNPGNAADQLFPFNNPNSLQFGAVAYNYQIGTYDVTNSQYVEFLNAKDPTGANPLLLYNSDMSSAPYGGINFNNGNLPGNMYSVISGDGNHPVNNVTWYSAIRFANWLNNGQGSGDTETGAYTLSNGNTVTRNAGAAVFLPSEDEWYKAAYYDPRTTAQGGPPSDSHYWPYPTSSNAAPTGSSPTGAANHANISPGGPINLTDVGAYTGTTSPYGAFDMGGNVYQWNEGMFDTGVNIARIMRGGSFNDPSLGTMSSVRFDVDPTSHVYTLGFRVASNVPEPSSLVLAALGFVGLAAWAWRKRA